MKNWDKLNEDEKMKYAEGPKTSQKKNKKKKQDEAFRPGADE